MTVEQMKIIISAETKGLQTELKGVKDQLKTMEGQVKETGATMDKSFNKSIGSISKVKVALAALGFAAIRAAKNVATIGAEAITVDAQIQNLGKTMGDSASEFAKWGKDSATQFGISEQAAVSFGNQFSSIIARTEKNGEAVSDLTKEYLKMGSVIAANTHFDIDDVMGRIRSGLSGRNEAIEDLGIEVKPHIIQSTQAYANAVRQTGLEWKFMSDAQQAQVRTQAILEQGNARYGTSLQGTALQMAIMKAELANLRLAWGRAFAPILEVAIPILKVLVVWVRAAAMVVKDLLSLLFGKSISSGGGLGGEISGISGGVADIESGVDGIGSGLDKATAAARKLNRQLFGWDVIHNIDEPQATGGAGGGSVGVGGGIGGIGGIGDASLYDELNSSMGAFDATLGKAKDKTEEIRRKMLDWLGYTYDINKNTGELVNLKWGGWSEMSTSAKLLAAAFAAIAALKVGSIISSIGTSLGFFSGAAAAGTTAAAGVGVATAGFGATMVAALPYIAAILAAIVAVKLAFEAYKYAASPAIEATDLLADTSEQTRAAMTPFLDKMEEVNQTISKFTWSRKIISNDDVAELKGNIDEVKTHVQENLVGAMEQAKQKIIDGDYFRGLDPTLRGGVVEKIEEGLASSLAELDEKTNRMNEIVKTAARENRSLTENENQELKRLQRELMAFGIRELTENEKDQDTILRNIMDNTKNLEFEKAQAIMKSSIETKNAIIEDAEERYAEEMRIAEGIKDVDEELYNELAANAKEGYNTSVREAETGHKNIMKEINKYGDDFLNRVDEDTGESLSKWESYWKGVASRWTTSKKTIETPIDVRFSIGNVQAAVDEQFRNLRVPGIRAGVNGPGISMYAGGGFPEDGLFFANSNELVGKFTNGKTAVANNDQIVSGVSSGVAQAVRSVLGNQKDTTQPINLTVQIGSDTIAKEVIDAVDNYTMRTGMTFKTI